jgi:opacity protein-like surface antigen
MNITLSLIWLVSVGLGYYLGYNLGYNRGYIRGRAATVSIAIANYFKERGDK